MSSQKSGTVEQDQSRASTNKTPHARDTSSGRIPMASIHHSLLCWRVLPALALRSETLRSRLSSQMPRASVALLQPHTASCRQAGTGSQTHHEQVVGSDHRCVCCAVGIPFPRFMRPPHAAIAFCNHWSMQRDRTGPEESSRETNHKSVC